MGAITFQQIRLNNRVLYIKRIISRFQVSRSNSKEVTLTDVKRETSGEFKCEVSADAPLFHTEIRSAHLLVAGKYHTIVSHSIKNLTSSL